MSHWNRRICAASVNWRRMKSPHPRHGRLKQSAHATSRKSPAASRRLVNFCRPTPARALVRTRRIPPQRRCRHISTSTSQLNQGRNAQGQPQKLEALHADIIVPPPQLRRRAKSSRRLEASVINAGRWRARASHPGLLEPYLREKLGRVAGLHVASSRYFWFSRVARSNIWMLLKLGARVTLVGPARLSLASLNNWDVP